MTDQVKTALETQGAVNLEFFYWMSIAIMMLIHAGFLAYESGASRVKNVLAAAMKNLMTLAVVIPSFFFVGWFLYNAMPTGVPRLDDLAKAALPWSANMGPNITDSASGVFFGAFALFAATTGSIMSGSLIERVRLSAFLILTVILGSVVWIIAAAWGWHPAGWLVTEFGLRDVGAAGCVHLVAGAFTLGVLIHLGPRIGKFSADGTRGRDPPAQPADDDARPHADLRRVLRVPDGLRHLLPEGYTTIFGTPTNAVGLRLQHADGARRRAHGRVLTSKSEPFWTVSGGLAGVIAVAAGIDLYHPALAFVIAVIGGAIIPYSGRLVEKFGIDDAVGAVSVRGVVGVWSLLACGIFASGYPSAVGGPDISSSARSAASSCSPRWASSPATRWPGR